MATRRRYGTYGRAVTLPAPVLSPTGDWPRATELPWSFEADYFISGSHEDKIREMPMIRLFVMLKMAFMQIGNE
ncbi:hypothetical protein ANCDUO_22917 [Ancylostoma duodenale]|uniref:Uncharacterized protein n=1 Tax=Ancylostoma duodenale TaxID=51022 RepID=A0A0C2CAZ6_9BILA|nr:hypothetical protein ANCDUO_22917 [Ancylostoma duodenale]